MKYKIAPKVKLFWNVSIYIKVESLILKNQIGALKMLDIVLLEPISGYDHGFQVNIYLYL